MKRAQIIAAGYIVAISLLDIVITTVLYSRGNQFKAHFIAELRYFDIKTCFFELWIFGAIRFIICFGAVAGALKNPGDAFSRIEWSGLLIFSLAACMWSYSIVKVLLYSVSNEDWKHDAWFWSLFSWSVFSSILFYANWTQAFSAFEIQEKKEGEDSKGDSSSPLAIDLNQSATRDSELAINSSGYAVGTIDSAINSTGNAINSSASDREPLLVDEEAGASGEEKSTENSDKKNESEKKSKGGSMATVARLLRLSKPDIHLVILAFFFLLCAVGAETFTPYFTGRVIQGIAIDRDHHMFTTAIIYMTLFSVGGAIATSLRGWVFTIANSRLNIRLRNLLFASIMNQEVGFFDTVKTGDISSRLQSDTTTMSDTLALNVNVFLRSIIKSLGVIVFMVRLSWRLSMVTLIGLPIITAFSAIYGDYYQKLSELVQDALARGNEVAEETCSSMRTVRSFASEAQETRRYRERMAAVYSLNMKEARAYAGYLFSNYLFEVGLLVSTLYYGGWLVLNDFLTPGAIVSFILYQEQLGYCIQNIGYVYTGLMQAVGASSKVFEYIDRRPKLQHSGKMAPEKLEGKLEFQNVCFAYPSRPDTTVLKDVSFRVEPGEVVALVGPSGGGKSSCVNLLQHFYETQQGRVLIDGVPVSEYDHAYLHEKISLVGQEPVLFARTIRENIAYGMEDCELATVERAAKLANAHNFISNMKDKYDTETGEKGIQLSGGQKQRIAIARAIIRNPSILLLDEATSALDSESEYLVQQALYENLKERTVLIIAHRLSTVEKASRIIVIDKGKVVEQGTHAQLLSNGAMYAQLVRRQLLGFDVLPSGDDANTTEAHDSDAANLADGGGSEDVINERFSSPKLSNSITIHKEDRPGDGLSVGSFKSYGSSA